MFDRLDVDVAGGRHCCGSPMHRILVIGSDRRYGSGDEVKNEWDKVGSLLTR